LNERGNGRLSKSLLGNEGGSAWSNGASLVERKMTQRKEGKLDQEVGVLIGGGGSEVNLASGKFGWQKLIELWWIEGMKGEMPNKLIQL